MAASTSIASPILVRQVLGTGTAVAQEQRMLEKATQTFLQATPVQIDVAGATGFIIACPVMTNVATALIAGFSIEPGANLTTSGIAKTQNLTQKPPNQPLAVITPIGAPPNDGTTGFAVASDQNIFIGTLGDSSNNALAILAQALVGGIFGLFKDPGNNLWYVDFHVTTAATGACVEILGLEDAVGTLNGRVRFRVTEAAQQISGS
jgi:hypothetical protein